MANEKVRMSDAELLAEGKIPGKRLFAYAAGIAGQNMHYGLINQWLFYFCNYVLKIDERAVGIITSVSRMWDSINDPLIGALIDRHTFKKTGEKLRPFLIYLPPVIAALSVLLFKDWGFSENGKIAYIFIFYILWDVFYSMQDVALWGMLAVSSPLSTERARAAQWTALGVSAGAAIPGVFPIVKDIMVQHMSMQTAFLIAAIVLGAGGQLISMSAARMKEAVTEENKEKESLLEAVFVLRHNKTMLLISLARILDYVKLSVPQQYFFESCVSYKIGSMEIGGGLAQTLYGGLTYAPGTLMMFAANKIVDKVGGMKKILILAQVSSVVLRIVSYFVGYNSLGKIAIVILIMALQGIPANMMNIAHRSLMSDSIDYVEYKTGKRTEGITFSMQNFATKIGEAILLFINGQLLSLVGFNKNLDMRAQSTAYMKWQWPMFILGPVVGAILYLIVIMFVKDDKEERKMIEAALKERRKEIAEKNKVELQSLNA